MGALQTFRYCCCDNDADDDNNNVIIITHPFTRTFPVTAASSVDVRLALRDAVAARRRPVVITSPSAAAANAVTSVVAADSAGISRTQRPTMASSSLPEIRTLRDELN